MNEYRERSLYNELDKLATNKLQCYLLACQEYKYDDEVRVAANRFLRLRFINGENDMSIFDRPDFDEMFSNAIYNSREMLLMQSIVMILMMTDSQIFTRKCKAYMVAMIT